jgi:histidine ammonia-lyase
MGNAAGLKAWQVLANAERAIAIELLAAAQAVEFLAPLAPGEGASALHAAIRELSPRLADDRPLGADIEAVASAIRSGTVVASVELACGELA